MTWATFLLGIIGPLVARAVIVLGFTALTFTGVEISANQLVTMAQNNWSTIPLAVLQLASLSGIPDFFGMVFGALVARLAIWASVGASRYILKV